MVGCLFLLPELARLWWPVVQQALPLLNPPSRRNLYAQEDNRDYSVGTLGGLAGQKKKKKNDDGNECYRYP